MQEFESYKRSYFQFIGGNIMQRCFLDCQSLIIRYGTGTGTGGNLEEFHNTVSTQEHAVSNITVTATLE